jgi:NADH-quinone oxidoreductase subunit C
MQVEALATMLAEKFGNSLKAMPAPAGELAYEVQSAELVAIATRLRDEPQLRFEILIDVAGLDLQGYGHVEWTTNSATASGFSRGVERDDDAEAVGGGDSAASQARRFAVVYQLLSVTHNHRLRLRAYCEAGEDPMIDSVTGVWTSADWFEREAYDLFGIVFRNHPDMRRLLTDYGFIGHPFRKDFPLIGNLEVRYDPAQKRVVYEPVSIEPRTLVPRVIRQDNRYDAALKSAPAAAPVSASAPVAGAAK